MESGDKHLVPAQITKLLHLVSSKCFTICFSVIFFLTRATWHIGASVFMIHWELFLSNNITVSAVTSDLYTACNLPAAPGEGEEEEVSHSQGGSTRHRHTVTETYGRWQDLLDSASPLLGLHSIPTDSFMSKSILKLGRWDLSAELIQSPDSEASFSLHAATVFITI